MLKRSHLVSTRFSTIRNCSLSNSSQSDHKTTGLEPAYQTSKVASWIDQYEHYIGVKAVRLAQEHVMKCEENLSKAQMIRREKQSEINNMQSRLKEIHFDLDRTSRGEDRYLQLLTEEHQIIKRERELLNAFEKVETAEREAFHKLSNSVRGSHEKEREQSEKTKWWGVSASLAGALIGIVGATIGNELRMRKFREVLPMNESQLTELAKVLSEQHDKVNAFLSELRSTLKVENGKTASDSNTYNSDDYDKLLLTIREETNRLSLEMRELSRLANLEAVLDVDPKAVVYVGSEMERLLDQTERNIESKMKLQTLLSVVFLYTAIAVTAPWLYAVFKGD